MFKDLRFIRALLYLYLGTAVGFAVLLLCMSFVLISSPALNGSTEMALIPIDNGIQGSVK
jgi:prephenate dehydratase